jgi:hypothetical protein
MRALGFTHVVNGGGLSELNAACPAVPLRDHGPKIKDV